MPRLSQLRLARRGLLLLALIGALAGSARTAYACSPTQPLPNYTPPPATAAPSPPTPTTKEALDRYGLESDAVVFGTIQQVDGPKVVVAVETYLKTSPLPATLTITTYREHSDGRGADCELHWHNVAEPVVSLQFKGARAVFFLDSYADGAGAVVVGRSGPILMVENNQLREIYTGKPFGSLAQLDFLPQPTPAPAQPPPATPDERGLSWLSIAAPLALLALAGLILVRRAARRQ